MIQENIKTGGVADAEISQVHRCGFGRTAIMFAASAGAQEAKRLPLCYDQPRNTGYSVAAIVCRQAQGIEQGAPC